MVDLQITSEITLGDNNERLLYLKVNFLITVTLYILTIRSSYKPER